MARERLKLSDECYDTFDKEQSNKKFDKEQSEKIIKKPIKYEENGFSNKRIQTLKHLRNVLDTKSQLTF